MNMNEHSEHLRMEVRVRSVVIFGRWDTKKSRNGFRLTHFASTHLNLASGCELTVHYWVTLPSIQIPHPGSKREEFKEFLSSGTLYPFHFPHFLLYTNQLLWLPTENSHTSTKLPVWLLLILGASQDTVVYTSLFRGVGVRLESCHQQMPQLRVPAGTVGVCVLCPIQAVVSSHEQTGSVLGSVVDSPKSATLASSAERERWLEELPQLRASSRGSQPFPCQHLSNHPKGWLLCFTQLWVVYSKVQFIPD